MSIYPQPSSSFSYRRRRRLTPLKLLVWVLVLVVLMIPGISAYVAWTLTHPNKQAVDITPKSIGVAYEEVGFASADGTQLRGWLLKSSTPDRVVVMAHGYRGNRISDKPSLPTAKALVEKGFNVLMFDFRNSGLSDGSLTTVGALEKDDLLAAIHYVKNSGFGEKGIGLLGFSMGASTSLLAAADDPEVNALIVDSPFSDLTSYLKENLTFWTHLPDVPFTQMILWEVPMLIGHKPDEVSPLSQADKLKDRPILFIHGTGDKTINPQNSKRLMAALDPNRVELWSVEGAHHVGTFELDPVAYMTRVTDFFAAHLGQPSKPASATTPTAK